MSNPSSQKISELLSEFKSAMLVTHGSNGQLHARPMMIAGFDGNELTFLTAVDSNKAAEVSNDQRVAVTLQRNGAYMSLTGHGRVDRDAAEARRLWSLVDNAWFDGPSDPRLGILNVRLETAEYWDNRGRSLLRYAVDAVRTRMGEGNEPANAALHGVIDLS